ncbi:probable RNA 3'-terminal phosphate cyclase-like protein [Macrosteles quadrilineatus]|uniref:probable RNA 3'-terminal phosphate cyclase-like protein n=1 Tax=Macrosteles quadrilineatus TaxID=74068 RepID=UPI0023E123AB|nr:probable RNA 3'-terminal phosphate cyclase-like protein [Macrosteles quadrilineatus]
MGPLRKNIISFKGSNYLRQRLVLSVLSGKAINISEIRAQSDEPGLQEYEVNLLRLLDKLTNGTTLEINETGTEFDFMPGALIGGTLEHECCKQRGIGYYLEVVLSLAPFCKKALSITLRGVTNNEMDPSVDLFKAAALPILGKFLVISSDLTLVINKRGMEPEGGGEVVLNCPAVRQLRPVQVKDSGKIKRIRGVVFALRVSPSIANRIVEAAKGELLHFLPDVFISVDHRKGKQSGKSPGYGGCIYGESTTGVVLTGETASRPPPSPPLAPDDMGRQLAWTLLEEVSRGGCVDSSFQSLACLYMSLTQKDVSQFVSGPLSPYTISFLRHLRTFFGVTFKLEPYQEENEENLRTGVNKVLLTCLGVGYNKLV